MARLGLLALALLLLSAVVMAEAARPVPWRCGPCRYAREWARDTQARHDRALRIWPHRAGGWPSYAR